MNEAAQARLRALRQARDGLPFVDFQRRHSPELGQTVPAHLRELYGLIQESRHRPVYATVSLPPRGGKSTTLRNGLAYRLLRDPACLNFYATFGDELAKDFSYKTRKLARKAGVPLAADRANVHDWATMFDGGLKATSVGGDITGRGCNGGVIVCDDLIKGREAAESKRLRDKAWDYLLDDVLTRVERGASVIIVGTRWHVDDPIGRILKDDLGETWRHIRVAAVVDRHGAPVDGGPRGDEFLDGEHVPYWPEAGNDLAWARKQRAKGAHRWWSLYQQEPRPREGKMFGEPARFRLADFDLDAWRLVLAYDPAGTANTSSDFQAAGVLALRGSGLATEARPIACLNEQESVPAFIRRIQRLRERYPLPLWVEGVGGFSAMPDVIRALAPEIPVQAIPGRLMKGGKMERATALSEAWNDPAARFAVPLDEPGETCWDDYIEEFRDFTGVNDPNDNQVDWTAHAWNIGAADSGDGSVGVPISLSRWSR